MIERGLRSKAENGGYFSKLKEAMLEKEYAASSASEEQSEVQEQKILEVAGIEPAS